MSAWDEILRKSVTEKKSIEDICKHDGPLYQRYVDEQRQGLIAAPTTERERPIAKGTTASDAMLMFAKRLIAEGKAATMLEAMVLVHREHPTLYATHKALSEGK